MSVVYWYKYLYVSIMLNHVPSKQIGLHNNGINWFKVHNSKISEQCKYALSYRYLRKSLLPYSQIRLAVIIIWFLYSERVYLKTKSQQLKYYRVVRGLNTRVIITEVVLVFSLLSLNLHIIMSFVDWEHFSCGFWVSPEANTQLVFTCSKSANSKHIVQNHQNNV